MRIIFLLISCAFSFTACSGTGVGVSPDAPSPAAARHESAVNLLGITKVGDLPQTDSSTLAIQCQSELICWLNTPKLLWRTDDGGKSWQLIFRAPNDEEILAYRFIDAQKGWSFSYDNLYHTADGGKSWTKQESPINDPNGELRSLWFLANGKTGWLAGGIYRDQTTEELKYGVPNNARDVSGKRVLKEAIFRTSDAGQTWVPQSLERGTGRVLKIQFLDEKHGMALGERVARYTEDGGVRWKPIIFNKSCVRKEYLTEEYEATPNSVALLDSKVFWLSYTDGRIAKSLDGGRQWCDLIHPGQIAFEREGRQFFSEIHLDNPEHGWGLGADGHLYETSDAGKNWTTTGGDDRFISMTFLANRHGFLISDKSMYAMSP